MDCNVGAQLGRQFTKDALMMQQQQGAMHADPSIAQRDALMSGVMMGPEVNANDWLASHAEQQMHAARMQNEMEKAFMAGAGPVHVAPPPATADQAAMMQGGMMAGPQAMMAATMAMSMPMMVPRTQYQPTNFLGAATAPVTTAQPTSAMEDQAWSMQLGEQNWAQDYTNAPVFSLDGQEAQTVTEKTKNSEFYGFMDKIRNKELLIDEEKGEVVAGPGPEQPTDADSAYLQDWAATEGLDMPASYFRSPPPDAHLANMDDYAKELDLADNDAEEWAKQYAESQRNTFNNTDYPFEPNNPHLYHDDPFHEGQNLLALGNLSEAALAFEAACQKDNDHFEAWRLLGRTQSENEKDSLAILALNNARRLRPKDLDTHAKLAVAYFNEHNSEYSMDCLKMWLTSHPDYEHVGNMTIEPDADLDLDLCDGFFADPTRFRELTTLYGAALEMNPNDYMLHLNLGVLHNIARDFDAAAESFRQCVRLKPDAPELWNKLGASLANGSREREALDAYNRALDLNPGYVRTMYNIAVAYNNLEQPTQAAKHMVRAIAVQEGGTKPVGEGSRMATRFMWDFLRMTLNISNRPDLVELAQHEDIEPFVKEFGLEGLV